MTDEQENLSRRERRARAKGGDEQNESVKDRNQRLRADAASKRRAARTAERDAAAAAGLDASERVDDALVRSADATGKFVRENFAWLQWIIILGVASAIGILIVDYRREVSAAKDGKEVASALAGEWAKVASSEPAQSGEVVDTRKEYSSRTEKDEKALEGWRKLAKTDNPDIAVVAELGAANTLFDLEKYTEAEAAYQAVAKRASGASQTEVRARADEGVGLALEAQGKYPEALKAFEKLANHDGYKDLSEFHLARVKFSSGDREAALKLLSPLNEKLSKDAGPEGPTDYLGAAVRDLLKSVDPTFATKELAELKRRQEAEQQERFRKMLEEMQKRSGKDGSPLSFPGLPPSPAAPSGAEAPAPEPGNDAELPVDTDSSDSAPAKVAPSAPAKGAPPRPSTPAAPSAPAPSPAQPAGTAPPAGSPPAAAPPVAPIPAPSAPAPVGEGSE